MADNFVQIVATNTIGTTSRAESVTGVVAGNALVAFLWLGTSAPTIHTVTDSAGGTFNAKGSPQPDASNGTWLQAYVLEDAAAGTHTVTGTSDSGISVNLYVVEVGVSGGGGSYSGASSNLQAVPTLTTDAITTGTITVSAASTLVAIAGETNTNSAPDEPAAGTGFTSRGVNTNANHGAWRIETKAAAANAAATFTSALTTAATLSFGVAILNTGVVAAANPQQNPSAAPRGMRTAVATGSNW